MQNIDFLPADFKRRRTKRHGRSWQLIVGAIAIGLLLLVAAGQSRAKRQIAGRLESIEPQRQLLAEQMEQLDSLRDQLAEREAEAELIAYTAHPWPKTQLLAAALRDLPDAVVFHRVRLTQEGRPGQPSRLPTSESAAEHLEVLAPALRDLRLLRQQYDEARVAVALEGTTTDGIELHRYLDRMNDVPLLDKVELQSLESNNEGSEVTFRFEARLTARPGFGQPGGPNGRSRRFVPTAPPGDQLAAEGRRP